MNQDVFKRNNAIRLFTFFPLNKRSELHNYLVKIPEYVEFNEDNREMPRVLFNDTTQKNLNTIIHAFIINGIKQDILPKIYNSIYDGMLELEPDINDMVVTDTTAELIEPQITNAFNDDNNNNNEELPLAIPIAKSFGGKRTKNKRKKQKNKKTKRAKKTKKQKSRRQ